MNDENLKELLQPIPDEEELDKILDKFDIDRISIISSKQTWMVLFKR